jgi:DNA polymerase-3 subunit alpha
MILLKARISLREEEPKLIAEEVIPLEDVQDKMTRSIAINMAGSGVNKKTLESLKLIISNHRGSIPVYLTFRTPENKSLTMAMGSDFSAQPSVELIEELEDLLGEGAVSVKHN